MGREQSPPVFYAVTVTNSSKFTLSSDHLGGLQKLSATFWSRRLELFEDFLNYPVIDIKRLQEDFGIRYYLVCEINLTPERKQYPKEQQRQSCDLVGRSNSP